jgi:hypothetical protein
MTARSDVSPSKRVATPEHILQLGLGFPQLAQATIYSVAAARSSDPCRGAR